MVTYTSSSTYWSPLKPRIRIYALQDTTYASPIYSYNPFTDVGETTKPIALTFDSQTTNAGTFSIEIEDKDTQLDPDTFTKGNRVFIDCSKDGTTFQPAFKGLVRATEQNIYATTGRNLVLQGYSYLVRLNERVINTIKESTGGITGIDYDRTDSNMFTNNLINDILSTDSNYINSVDDTQLYSIFKKDNLTFSPVEEWIPRLDAQLVTVNDAINSVLESSNGLVMINPADDQLVLYTSDLITSATGIFLLTNQINENADDADYTMYPLESYKYNVSYDYPDSGSRLIGSIGSIGCPAEITEVESGSDVIYNGLIYPLRNIAGSHNWWYSCTFTASTSPFRSSGLAPWPKVRVIGLTTGNCSFITGVTTQIWTNDPTTNTPLAPLSPNMTLSFNSIGNPFPSSPTTFNMDLVDQAPSPVTNFGVVYHFVIQNPSGQSNTNYLSVRAQDTNSTNLGQLTESANSGTTWTHLNPTQPYDPPFFFKYPVIQKDPCGSVQATIDADPVFAIAHDRNMSNRLGVVERVITGIPTHIKTKQTLDEYLFNKLYFASKPRFTFDFPSVTMPNKLPKAGDICAHVDTRTNTGLADAPIQTGVISSVSYDFAQGTDGALGLRKIGLSTTGIKRGSY